MNISVVLSTFKRPEALEKTLQSFSSLEIGIIDWDLWIVDNANDPATRTLVYKYVGRLPINYLIETKAGKNNALNHALGFIKGDLVVFTDDDIIASTDWLKQFLEGAQRWPDHKIFGGRVLPYWPEGVCAPDLPLDDPLLINAYSIADWNFGEQEYSSELVFGANLAIRAEIFKNGFCFDKNIGPSQDNNYIMGSETSLLRHLEAIGHIPVYLPKVLVKHIIRPEQVSLDWLKKRAFRAGRGVASRDTINTPTLLGVPRFLLRRMIEIYIKASFENDVAKKNMLILKYWYVKGQINQFYKMR